MYRKKRAKLSIKKPPQTIELKDSVFNRWIKIITLVIGLATVCTFTWQIIEIRKQNESIEEQNRAMWFSNRPILAMHAIHNKDIIPLKDDSDMKYKIKPEEYRDLTYFVYFTIENVSMANANIVSFIYELKTPTDSNPNYYKIIGADTINPGVLPIGPKSQITEKMTIPILESFRYRFKITVNYSWDIKLKDNEVFPCVKCYEAIYEKEDKRWKTGMIGFTKY